MTAVTPGWYPDPWQQAPLRYWGGSAWTAALSHSSSQQQTNAAFACPDSGAGQHQMPSSQPITSQQKGAALEQQIAAFLRTNGYETQTNVVLTGRSGAPHELDVLGVKHDQLTPFRVAVECKAWERPIEKDVVAKFAYVLGDIGIREGIIACLAGYRSGAETAAIEMGITLWGADELSSRLGRVVLGDLSTRAPQHVASGLPFTLSMELARPLIERETKGRLGFGGEEIVWMSPVWLPVAVTQIAVSQLEGRIKKVMQTRRVWNAYELIDGELVWSFAAAPALSEVDLAKRSIRPKRKQTAVLR